MTIIIALFSFMFGCNGQISNTISNFGCPGGAVIEWVDMIMINDIKYQHHYTEPTDENYSLSIEAGNKIGEVNYKMADSACSNHKMKNGDAAYIDQGTPIYEVKGLPSSLAVLANERVFIVETNKKAKTAGELSPLEGLVKNIYIESTEDGSRIHTFHQQSVKQFMEEWQKLSLEDVDSLYKQKKMEGNRVFLGMELINGVSFTLLYWVDSNIFHNGAIGTEEIKEVINHELSLVK